MRISVRFPPKTALSAGPRVQLHGCCLSFERALSEQQECFHGFVWGLEGAVHAALIVSFSDLREAPLPVSVTGWAEGCASLVFDLCVCAEGRGSNVYRTTVAFIRGVKAKFITDCVTWSKSPNLPEHHLARLYKGLAMQPWDLGGLQ